MKQSLKRGIGMALFFAAAFSIGVWFTYWVVMWSDVLFKAIEMAERVFK